jgi:hypothetical protein
MPRRREDNILVETVSLAAIERVAAEGIAAIERCGYILISGPEDRRALLQHWNPVASLNSSSLARAGKWPRAMRY